MRPNDELKIHFVNVNHGDATILEFADYGAASTAHFAVIDFGAKKAVDRGSARDYLRALIEHRRDGDPDFSVVIEFACATHPHDDHFGGMKRFMDEFGPDVRAFWDCGFRTNSLTYNDVLEDVIDSDTMTFVRMGSGSEYEYGQTRVSVLAPSVDLRNRFDTYGIGKNDASIVLRVKFGNSYIILGADAEYASWGKITEEFPRQESIHFFDDALGLSERDDTSDQLKCDLLKVAHHGSKHGSSLEYLERLQPNRIVLCAGSPNWYTTELSNWAGKFPHPLVTQIFDVLDDQIETFVTGVHGNLIFKYSGNFGPRDVATFLERPDDPAFPTELAANWG